ncbi:MAG: putative glycoside hydrolase [Candidatus Buchananbacteria bacterium]|nr:putative glycoside hydrolase [Candidatus Buchananbacteria bacterium]
MVLIISFINTFFVFLLSLFFAIFLPLNQSQPTNLAKPALIENKGIYLTAYTAGNQARMNELVDLIKATELNTVVIDIKDYTGKIFFAADIPLARKIGSEEIRLPDLKNLLASLKEQGIYTIARITVFQDPYLAESRPNIALKDKSGNIWRDWKGLSWVDPTQQLVWDYNIDLARQAVAVGFDEVNFDYVRFPSDGDIKQIAYANLADASYEGKSKVMAAFYKYIYDQLRFEPIVTSADLFGMVMWRSDGLNIGQRYQDAAPYFDYICPMVYPSHFPDGFEGFANPAEHPYEVIYRSLVNGEKLVSQPRAKLRPWLQDFNIGAVYDGSMIESQKKATYDAGGYG